MRLSPLQALCSALLGWADKELVALQSVILEHTAWYGADDVAVPFYSSYSTARDAVLPRHATPRHAWARLQYNVQAI